MDPVIDPDYDGSRRRRRRRGSSSSSNVPAPATPARGHGGPADPNERADANSELLSVMRQLLNDIGRMKVTESESSWTSAKGPARGVNGVVVLLLCHRNCNTNRAQG